MVLTCGVVAGVLLAGASQLAARDAGDLDGLAASGATVTLTGTLTSEPARVRSGPPDAPPRYRATLAVDDVGTRGEHRAASAPVTVLTGSPWPGVSYGARVVVRGRLAPGTPGRRAVALLQAGGTPALVEPPGGALLAVDAVRSGLRDVCAGLGADARGLVPGIAVGDTSALPDDLDRAMRDSGLTHVTAVSGAHFSIVGAGVLVLTGAAGLPRRARAAVVCAVMLGFVVLVHPGPSVLRAAAMGAVGLGALVLGRPARAVPALAAAVVVLLVADPWLARELGFVLSVVATSGLVLLAGPLARRWSGSARAPVAYALAVPVAAQSVCAPVVLLLSPAVALYAVPANVLVAPAVAPATVLGLLAALVSPWWHAAGVILAELAGLACWWIATVARVAAALPGAQVAWTPGVVGLVLLAAGTAAGLALLLGRPPGDVDHGVGTATERVPGRRRAST
ncbi:ComEC/Rec2 family competence protein [Cellulomonas sp. NS3]|uniref:ComEC/Rec2 family competence protein n=1 Tax=Cellulomonas sp. NS3 TaxID=2973977 RepID=UPI002161D05D|nr:ComEC/Rec2 family competence protein [Cellulomonas sp. NS3]